MSTLAILALVFTIAASVCTAIDAVKKHNQDVAKIENNLFERLKDLKH